MLRACGVLGLLRFLVDGLLRAGFWGHVQRWNNLRGNQLIPVRELTPNMTARFPGVPMNEVEVNGRKFNLPLSGRNPVLDTLFMKMGDMTTTFGAPHVLVDTAPPLCVPPSPRKGAHGEETTN